MRISFLNGKFIEHKNAYVHIEDRAMQFSDGVYEVILFNNGKLVDYNNHIIRLFNSLSEIKILFSYDKQKLKSIILELFKQNNLFSGSVYIQITRGVFNRSQFFPDKNIDPSIIITVLPEKTINTKDDFHFSAITCEDIRWSKCNIKSVSLLPNILCKQKAKENNCSEAIFIRDRKVTEGSFSNVFMVNDKDQIITRYLDNYILGGITRSRVIDIAKKSGMTVIEQEFSKNDLLNAKEIFTTSSTLMIRPIIKIDNKEINKKETGDITANLINLYSSYIKSLEI